MTGTTLDHSASDNFDYDVVVSMPLGIERDILQNKAMEGLGVSPEAVATLMKSLTEHRVVKVKSSIPRQQAEEVAAKFSSIGFRVEINHSLNLQKIQHKESSNQVDCPSCDKRVVLTSDRQCPECGVFVDKLSEEFLLRKQIMAKERARMEALKKIQDGDIAQKQRDDLEKKLREEIKAELEKELGLEKPKKPLFSGKFAKFALPVSFVALTAGAFVGGRATAPSLETKPALEVSSANGSSAGEGGQAAVGSVETFLKGSAKMGAAMSKNGSGLSMSEIIAQAQSPTGGADGASGGAVGGGSESDSLLSNPGKDNPAIHVPADAKRELATDLAVAIAEIGQIARARELVGRAYQLAGETPSVSQAVRLRHAHIRVESWALVAAQGAGVEEQINALDKTVSELPTAGSRAVGYASIGEILSASLNLKAEMPEAFFHRANQEFASEKDKTAQREATHQLLVSRGKGMLNAVRVRVEKGMLDKAKQQLAHLSGIANNAPPVTAAILLGFDAQAKQLLGDTAAATKSIEAALLKASKAFSMEEEALLLRSIVHGREAYSSEKVQASLRGLMEKAEKWGKRELAGALLHTGILHAANGNPQGLLETKEKLGVLATTEPGLDTYVGLLEGHGKLAIALFSRQTGAHAASDDYLRQAAILVL
jgi:hypothetical protein